MNSYKKKFFPWLPEDEVTNRNSDPLAYVLAIQNLLKKGYWVFRMGKFVEKPLNIKHERFIDYPYTDLQNDFLIEAKKTNGESRIL